MRTELRSILINPYTGNRPDLRDGALVDPETRERFPVIGGIPIMLREQEVEGLNRLYQRRYDSLSPFYDFFMTTVARLVRADAVFGEITEAMDVRSGDRVLETSVGTGRQIKSIIDHGMAADQFVGLDISMGMLRKCQRNMRNWRHPLDLVQGNAEFLPFADDTFDVVLHIGGINFFNDKERAILEMVRVARPGARLYIGDETEKQLQEQPSLINRFYQKPDAGTYASPVDLVPDTMEKIDNRELWDGKMYLISFQKPA